MSSPIKNIQTPSSTMAHCRRYLPAPGAEGIKITMTEVDMLGGNLKRSMKQRGRPPSYVDMLDMSNPKSRRLILDYVKTCISTDRTLASKAPLIDSLDSISSPKLSKTIQKRGRKAGTGRAAAKAAEYRSNSMHQLIKTLKESRIERPEMELILLDSSYINSIVAEGESVKRVITKLHEILNKRTNGNFEIIMTKGVYDELDGQLKGPNGPKRDEFGRPIITSLAMDELRRLIYPGADGSRALISLENYEFDEESRQELAAVLRKRNRKCNSRIGVGDTSILKCIKDMFNSFGNVAIKVLTNDSDMTKILRGCERFVRALTGRQFRFGKADAST